MMPAFPPLPREDLIHVLAHTRELWEEMRGASIFITGGTGFFGMWLLESFVHANEELGLHARAVVLTRDPVSFAAKAPHLAGRNDLDFIRGDVRDFEFPEGQFPFVIHAGTTSSEPVESLEMFETIVDGTKRVLNFAATRGARKFLFVSSGAVYGRQPPELTHIPEDYTGAPDPLDPSSAYGEGKRAAELLCSLAAKRHGFEIKIARCFAFVGPHLPLDAHFAIGNFIRDVIKGRPIHIKGDGTPHRSYLYAADLAIWLWTITFRGTAGCAYNVGSDQSISISELASLVRGSSGADLKIDAAPREGAPPTRYVPETKRARIDLNLLASTDLIHSVEKTSKWYQLHRNL